MEEREREREREREERIEESMSLLGFFLMR